MKSEIERINTQTVTKAELKALEKAVKKAKAEEDPESTHEPKGKRGPPRKIQLPDTGAASSSQAPVKKRN